MKKSVFLWAKFKSGGEGGGKQILVGEICHKRPLKRALRTTHEAIVTAYYLLCSRAD